MKKYETEGQLTLFDLDMVWEMSPELLARKRRGFPAVLEETCRIADSPFLYLDLRERGMAVCWGHWDRNFTCLESIGRSILGPRPKTQKNLPCRRFYRTHRIRNTHLSKTACLGILRRAKKRDKELPPVLKKALEIQAGIRTVAEEQTTNA